MTDKKETVAPCVDCITLPICKAEARDPDYIASGSVVSYKTFAKCSKIQTLIKSPYDHHAIVQGRKALIVIRKFLNPNLPDID